MISRINTVSFGRAFVAKNKFTRDAISRARFEDIERISELSDSNNADVFVWMLDKNTDKDYDRKNTSAVYGEVRFRNNPENPLRIVAKGKQGEKNDIISAFVNGISKVITDKNTNSATSIKSNVQIRNLKPDELEDSFWEYLLRNRKKEIEVDSYFTFDSNKYGKGLHMDERYKVIPYNREYVDWVHDKKWENKG